VERAQSTTEEGSQIWELGEERQIIFYNCVSFIVGFDYG
jgi:hypothetical protein